MGTGNATGRTKGEEKKERASEQEIGMQVLGVFFSHFGICGAEFGAFPTRRSCRSSRAVLLRQFFAVSVHGLQISEVPKVLLRYWLGRLTVFLN